VSLPTRTLGRTGHAVTVLGFGAMELRGLPRGPEVSDADAERLLHAVLDSGINLIDTSVDYGRSEELIGRFLRARRDEYFLCSKCGCPLTVPPDGTPPYAHDYTAENVRADVEQSLQRLQTDRIDLVQVHMSPTVEEMRDGGTVDELVRLRDEGKIRFLGMSGTLPELPDHIDMGVFDVFQIPYSLFQRRYEPWVARAGESGAGVLVRGGVGRGTASEDKNWSVQPLSEPDGVAADIWEQARLDELLDGIDRHEFVLRFTLHHPQLSTTIVGTSKLAHLQRNVEMAARGPLPDDVYDEAVRRLDAAGE
jgi:aryl-alcohol dehydrogenase-like predicted oxidoreductase